MSHRHGQPPVVLADRFSNWVNPAPASTRQRAMTLGHVAEIWSPNYKFHVKAQTAMMGSDLRVRLYECIKQHISSSENPPPNTRFWREIISNRPNCHEVGRNNAGSRRASIFDRTRRDGSRESRRSARSDHSPGKTGTHSPPLHIFTEKGPSLYFQNAAPSSVNEIRVMPKAVEPPQLTASHVQMTR